MRAAASGTGVQIYGDGEQRRDLVHVYDVAWAEPDRIRARGRDRRRQRSVLLAALSVLVIAAGAAWLAPGLPRRPLRDDRLQLVEVPREVVVGRGHDRQRPRLRQRGHQRFDPRAVAVLVVFALDEQARLWLIRSRLTSAPAENNPDTLRWGIATIEWGNDVSPPPRNSAPSSQ